MQYVCIYIYIGNLYFKNDGNVNGIKHVQYSGILTNYGIFQTNYIQVSKYHGMYVCMYVYIYIHITIANYMQLGCVRKCGIDPNNLIF